MDYKPTTNFEPLMGLKNCQELSRRQSLNNFKESTIGLNACTKGSWAVMNFPYTQQKFVLEINQSGVRGQLLSIVQRTMVTCVYRTNSSQNLQSSVISLPFYGCKKVFVCIYTSVTQKSIITVAAILNLDVHLLLTCLQRVSNTRAAHLLEMDVLSLNHLVESIMF